MMKKSPAPGVRLIAVSYPAVYPDFEINKTRWAAPTGDGHEQEGTLWIRQTLEQTCGSARTLDLRLLKPAVQYGLELVFLERFGNIVVHAGLQAAFTFAS